MSTVSGDKAARDPEVSLALDKQQREIEQLEDRLNSLAEKIKPVLRDEPANEATKELEEQSNVPLVNELNSKTRRVRAAKYRIIYLLEYCEL
jgi:mRNA-degrading endonuclease RelE of RelBE toxin-antitoxin system